MKLSDIIRDSRILTKRSMTHIVKNMDQLLGVVIMPVMFLLLFRYVFGGAIDTGGTTYINFLVAGILIQTLAFGASTTAISLVLDMKKGIVDRFKSLLFFQIKVNSQILIKQKHLESMGTLLKQARSRLRC
jgi:ABC-2 type transport system permease protein